MKGSSFHRRILAGGLPLISLASWAGMMIWFYFDSRINILTTPVIHSWILLAGILLSMIVIYRGYEIFKYGLNAMNCGEECRDSDELTAGKIACFILLILPVGISFFVDPTSFSGQFVRNRGVQMSAPQVITEGLPEMTHEEVQSVLADTTVYDTDVVEILMLADDPVARGALEKKPVSFIAQIVYPESKEPIQDRKSFYAVRLYMLCCAADARPVGILVKTDKSVDWKEMSWVKIDGILNYIKDDEKLVPQVILTGAELVEPPEEQYLY